MLDEVAEHAVHGRARLELLEDRAHDGLRLFVRVLDDLARGPAHVPDRHEHAQLAALGLAQLARPHPLLHQVQLRLAHGALEPEQQAVVVRRGVVHAIEVAEQRAEQRAHLEQVVPVAARAGQA
jgi:hypothetical protein